MLFSLMYHHINCDKFSNDLEIFKVHLEYLVSNYNIVTPEDILSNRQDNLCITFDDAYYDFYHYVFPLLKEYKIKAVLAVPTGLIDEQTTASHTQRLSLSHQEIYQEKNYRKFGSFCTWNEIKEMSNSGYVIMASHSHKHKDLASSDINLQQEIFGSKEILEEKLGFKVESFILPFGRYNKESLTLLKEHYKYIFKVGQGINQSFSGVNGLIYRIDADGVDNVATLFTFKRRIQYKLKSLSKYFYDGIQK